MRAGLSLLLCLLVSWAHEVQASEGETKPRNLLPNKRQPLDLDTTADQSSDQTSTKTDLLTEVRMLRDMVAAQGVELGNIKGRLKEAEMQADEQKLDLYIAKISLEELKRDHTAVEERLRASEKQVEELKNVNTEQSVELSDLRARLDASEREGEELRVDLQDQAAGLLSIEDRVEVSDGELQLLTLKMGDLQVKNSVQELELTSLMDKMNTTEFQVASLIKENAKVAFYTALTNSEGVGPYNTPTVLRFSKVFTNVGNAYSPSTGFFTAPVKGVYHFRFTICGHQVNGTMGLNLFLNDKPIMYNLQGKYKDYNFEYLSNAVTLGLNVGDELHMILPEETAIYDNVNNHSTFSGFLLFNM